MMYRILKDLEANVKKIYNSNLITVNKYLHHSLNYPEMTDLLKKYKANVDRLKKDLWDHINNYEQSDAAAPQPRRVSNPFGHNPFIKDFLGDDFEMIFNPGMTAQSNVFRDPDMVSIFQLAQQIEIPKLQRQAQENGGMVNPDDISLGSLLRAIIEVSQRNQKYAYLLKILKDSGFDVDKFLKDDKLGKSKNKKLMDEHCVNLNQRAIDGKLQSVIGRDEEVAQLINILAKARKNNPVLVGRAGVGKTAIVEGLAKKIVEGAVPDALKQAVVYELQVMNMVKGTQFRGQFEQKMSDLLEEFKDLEDSGIFPILFIDELHTIMGAGSGGQGGLDFSNIIKPALARGELRTIGATTTDEYHKFIRENPALDRRFVSLTVKEPDEALTKKILEGSIGFYELKHNVKYQPETLDRAIDLSKQFIVDNAFPDKAFDLLDYAGAMVNINNGSEVSTEDIEVALAKHKNVALDAIVASRKHNLERVSPKLQEVIFGQDEAISKVSRSVEKALAGLNAPDKPYGAFLFTGPTGTGKTELAKQIARIMRAHFHRIDMSEFMEPHSVAKILGSPAGYVGYEDGSSLAKVIQENPRTVLLLDEIEKAHPEVLKLLLQIMDYGKLSDAKGRPLNFTNVLLIMTSNAGVKSVKNIGLMKGDSDIDSKEVEKYFRPEFRARLTGNGPVEFKALTMDSLKMIVQKYIKEIEATRLNKLLIKIDLTPEALDFLAKEGESKNLGARPIKEAVESFIIDPLSEAILYGKLKDLKKEKVVKVEVKDGKINLKL